MTGPELSWKSVFGRLVHLSKKVWRDKILKNHPEFGDKPDYLDEIGKTLESPDYVVPGWSGEHLALRSCEFAPGGPKNLCVVYRELDDSGFVITAFFISKLDKLLRRGIVWRERG